MILFARHALIAQGLMAALLVASTTPVLAQKGGSKPPAANLYKYVNLGQVGYNNFSGGAKAYGITEPAGDGVLLAVGGGISTPSAAFDTAWLATASNLLNASPVPNSKQGTIAVNDLGMIAYYGYSNAKSANVGIVSVPGAPAVEIPNFRPTAVNNLGQVVGNYSGIGFLWTVGIDGTISNSASLGDFIPFAINDWGDMAGQQGSSAAIARFEDGVLKVQKLPGLYAGDYGRATGINNFGEVVGLSSTKGTSGALTGSYRPFLWRPTGGLTGLAGSGAALDINDYGQVVGWISNSKGYYAFLWSNGQLSDLNVLSGVGTNNFRLGSAEAINNAGQIIGRSDTQTRGGSNAGSFLLSPNP